MQKINRALLAFTLAALLAACATNGVAQSPNVTQFPLSSNKLQFAVGTANIGQDGVVGLNFVATLRQPNGNSGTLANRPSITGPAGFTVPAGASGAYPAAMAGPNLDAGTAHMSASPQVPRNNAGLVNTTFGTFTGVFAYGIGPFNSDQSLVSGGYYPGQPNASGGNGFQHSFYDGSSQIAALVGGADATLPVPLFAVQPPMVYLTGPPAVPFFNDGTFPINFAGYSSGFTAVELAPVAGQYTMNVAVDAQNASPITYTASATLTSTAALPAMATPTFVEDGTGGGSGTVTLPPGVTEAMVYIVNASTGLYFAIGPITGTGTQPYNLPDNLGRCIGANCQNGPNAAKSINPNPPPVVVGTGDTYLVAAVGYDYPAFEAGPPNNHSQTPTITGANGQADVTMSPVSHAKY